MDTETKIPFHTKLWYWMFGNVIAAGLWWMSCQVYAAYLTAFPTDQAKEAQAVSMLLEKTAARAEGVLSGRK